MRKSPLAEGRELKFVRELIRQYRVESPLAEGRELKYDFVVNPPIADASPLAEGRELKCQLDSPAIIDAAVAPRGGA